MNLESFIDWVDQADPSSAQMVRDGYCSWEDLGYDPGEEEHIDDSYEQEQEAYDYAMYEEHRHEH